MTLPAGIWTIDDVAAALGRSPSWIYKNRQRLERAGFPKPLPRLTNKETLRWRQGEVEPWIEQARLGIAAPANDRPHENPARKRMENRLANL